MLLTAGRTRVESIAVGPGFTAFAENPVEAVTVQNIPHDLRGFRTMGAKAQGSTHRAARRSVRRYTPTPRGIPPFSWYRILYNVNGLGMEAV